MQDYFLAFFSVCLNLESYKCTFCISFKEKECTTTKGCFFLFFLWTHTKLGNP